MKYDKEVFRSFTMIIQFGINMIVPIILCTFGGIYLDRWLGTSFCVIILFFFGALAGFTNIFKMVRYGSNKQSYIGLDAKNEMKENVKAAGLEEKRNALEDKGK